MIAAPDLHLISQPACDDSRHQVVCQSNATDRLHMARRIVHAATTGSTELPPSDEATALL